VSELRGLGGLVLEQALQDPAARPRASLVEWTARLTAELGAPPAQAPATGRPTEALPLAA
jgi:hypothetical protein